MSLWSRSTHISQSLAAFSGHESGGEGLETSFSPYSMKDIRCGNAVSAYRGMAWVDTLLHSRSAALWVILLQYISQYAHGFNKRHAKFLIVMSRVSMKFAEHISTPGRTLSIVDTP